MRKRKSARLLVISPDKKVLLFRFVHSSGALAGQNYWATPGGGLEEGESFQMSAIRELREETGIEVSSVAGPVAERNFPMVLPTGETVYSAEQYFVVIAKNQTISRAEWTAHEMQVMAEHHWWSADELRCTQEIVWPETLDTMLVKAGVFEPLV